MLSVAERAAEIMEHLCTHSAHGYSQPNRAAIGTGGSVAETITLSDGTQVGISGGDRDCSSACVECYAAQGIDVGGATYTGNMRSGMVGTGLFKWHPWGSGYTAKRGDLYLNETHHTAMCLGNGKLGEFSRSEQHSTHGAKGDQDGWESHVRDFYTYSHGWDGVLEYVGPEPSRHVVEEVQNAVYRLREPKTGLHLWTKGHAEAQLLSDQGWEDEGIGWLHGGTEPVVQRLCNPATGEHMLTVDQSEHNALVAAGWRCEGEAFGQGTERDVWRLYDQRSGFHMFTTSEGERDALVADGWKLEGAVFRAN